MEFVYTIQVLYVVLIALVFWSGLESSAVRDVARDSHKVLASSECSGVCNRTCPGRTALPSVTDLLDESNCSSDPENLPALANGGNKAVKFVEGDCTYVDTPHVTWNQGYFTVSLWPNFVVRKQYSIELQRHLFDFIRHLHYCKSNHMEVDFYK
ncbi:hypothetical protein MAR_015451, partial [Mya arenaria]